MLLRRTAGALAFALLAMLAVAPVATAAPPTGLTDARYVITFGSPSDSFTFQVQKAQGAGNLTVDSKDCCVPGDGWSSTVQTIRPAGGRSVTGVGDGNTSTYSGAATARPFLNGSVVVSYANGTDLFPASMCVRFRYSNASGVIITPPPGATTDPFCDGP
jgi:hypothetical protein